MFIKVNKSPLILPFKELLKMPVVIRLNKFNEDEARRFTLKMQEAHNTGQPVIPICIDSYGGAVDALLSMMSDIDYSDLPVATIGKGKSMSCGAILLSYGSPGYRVIEPNARVMVHQISSASWGKAEDIKSKADEMERLSGVVFEKMAKACGHSDKHYFLKLMEKHKNTEIYMSAREAKKHKIVDHLGSAQISVDISVDIGFDILK
jgi:ATP-dependent Clp endopeptidase proteolytic subunit ClpP